MALSGGAALIYEVASNQILFYFFNSSSYSMATVLTSFLLGLALGSLIITKTIHRIKEKQTLFFLLQLGIAIYAVTFLHRVDFVLKAFELFDSSFVVFSKFITGTLYLIFPTVLLGVAFPLAFALIKSSKEEGVKNVGLLYSWDLFGAIGGTLIAGFILLPLYGIKAACLAGAFVNFTSGFLVIEKDKKRLLLVLFGFIILLGLILSSSSFSKITESEKKYFVIKDTLSASAELSASVFQEPFAYEFKEWDVLFQAHSPYGEVAVVSKEPGFNQLSINMRRQCDTDSESEREIANIALELLGENLEVLNIGLGCGCTLDTILSHDNVAQVDLLEINPQVVEAFQFFAEYNNYALDDPRVNLTIGDGAEYLRTTDKKYDAIIIDIENPAIIHSSPLYTVEYFKEAERCLKDTGIFALWAYRYGEEYSSIIYHSLREAFDNVYLVQDFLFFASDNKLNIELTDQEKERIDKFEKEEDYTLSTLDYLALVKFFSKVED